MAKEKLWKVNDRVKVVGLHSSDSYAYDKKMVMGKTGRLDEIEKLYIKGYFCGNIIFDDKTSAFFLAVKLRRMKEDKKDE